MEKFTNAAQAGYHLSKYNIFSNLKNENLIACANLLRGTYSEISPSDLMRLYHLETIDSNDPVLKAYESQGIVANYDETEYIKSLFLVKNIENSKILRITIAPSLACNFNCSYCFENHSDKNVMSLETQDKLISFIKNIVSCYKEKKLYITWFGGEPLLFPEIIEYISKPLISFCEENDVKYSAGIITNGYYFNQKNVELLNKYKVLSAQITLDGLEYNHNLTRHLLNGEGSFKQIIDNLNTVNFDGIINIRNNIHNDNKQDVE